MTIAIPFRAETSSVPDQIRNLACPQCVGLSAEGPTRDFEMPDSRTASPGRGGLVLGVFSSASARVWVHRACGSVRRVPKWETRRLTELCGEMETLGERCTVTSAMTNHKSHSLAMDGPRAPLNRYARSAEKHVISRARQTASRSRRPSSIHLRESMGRATRMRRPRVRVCARNCSVRRHHRVPTPPPLAVRTPRTSIRFPLPFFSYAPFDDNDCRVFEAPLVTFRFIISRRRIYSSTALAGNSVRFFEFFLQDYYYDMRIAVTASCAILYVYVFNANVFKRYN